MDEWFSRGYRAPFFFSTAFLFLGGGGGGGGGGGDGRDWCWGSGVCGWAVSLSFYCSSSGYLPNEGVYDIYVPTCVPAHSVLPLGNSRGGNPRPDDGGQVLSSPSCFPSPGAPTKCWVRASAGQPMATCLTRLSFLWYLLYVPWYNNFVSTRVAAGHASWIGRPHGKGRRGRISDSGVRVSSNAPHPLSICLEVACFGPCCWELAKCPSTFPASALHVPAADAARILPSCRCRRPGAWLPCFLAWAIFPLRLGPLCCTCSC